MAGHGFRQWQNQGHLRKLHVEITSATGGAGATVEFEDDAGETIGDRGGTGVTLVLAGDTDDNAYDGYGVTVHYINTSGAPKTCYAAYNTVATTTEVAFADTATSAAVTDFVCLDPAFGTLAAVSSVAVQAGDNVCIGATGCVAGIADPDICYVKIAAAATSPVLLTGSWGIGSISGDEAANQADTGYIYYLEYVTVWGEIKHATWTFPADSSVSTRFISVEDTVKNSATTVYCNDFYRRRDSYLVNASGVETVALDEIRVGDWDAAAFYEAIEVSQSKAAHTRHFVPWAADVSETRLKKVVMRYEGVSTEYATVTLTFVIKDQAGTTTRNFKLFGYQTLTYEPDVELEECTELKAVVVDDAATGGNATIEMDLVEVF
jgi:hypothetical protein